MDYRIDTLRNFLKNNLRENFTIEELAQSVGLSESRLQHLFKHKTGTCITVYFRQIKLEKAAELLTTTFFLIKEIRQEVGIKDQKYFLKYFKQIYGMTPTEYRKKYFNYRKAQSLIADKIAESTTK